jgi:hypothetical protein
MHSIPRRRQFDTVSVTLIVSIMGLTTPANAQHPGPVVLTIPQAGGDAPSDSARSPSPELEAPWADVQEIESGQDIALTVHGSPSAWRYFVAADEASITVLDVTDGRIPNDVRRVLVDTAWERPERFVLARGGGTSLLDRRLDLRLGPAGVMLKGRGIIGLDEIVGQIARPEVAKIVTKERAVARGIGWGALAGGLLGLGLRTAMCRNGCETLGDALILPFATGVGIGVGAGIGSTTHVRTTVYEAP